MTADTNANRIKLDTCLMRPLSSDERRLYEQQLRRKDRVNSYLRTVNLQYMQIAYSYSPCGKWTYAILLTADGTLHVGVAKRLTYAPMADEHNNDTAMKVAFCRALETYPIYFDFGHVVFQSGDGDV